MSGRSIKAPVDNTYWWGLALVLLSLSWFLVTSFLLFGAKLLPKTNHMLIDFFRTDWYYR
jgi:hypothetical protein